jgi:hypothetical protein
MVQRLIVLAAVFRTETPWKFHEYVLPMSEAVLSPTDLHKLLLNSFEDRYLIRRVWQEEFRDGEWRRVAELAVP